MPWKHKCMAKITWVTFLVLVVTGCLVICYKMSNSNSSDDDFENLKSNRSKDDHFTKDKQNKTEEDMENSEYGEGSICIYCKYCKLCGLCKTDCPCHEDSKGSHCILCKYCPYCYHCSSVCETICTPGGFLDEFTSAMHKALPKINRETMNQFKKDINAVKEWVNEYII